MKIKVLYILSNEPTGGIGSFVQSFTSNFSSNIIVDYLIYTDVRNSSFQTNIKTNENTIYYLPELAFKNIFELLKYTKKFFKEHEGEYKIVHLHFAGIVNLCYRYAKKYGIEHRIIHSQNTQLSDNAIKSIRNKLLCFNYKTLANHYMACSYLAARYLYGDQMANSNEIIYIHNAIDCDKYNYNENKRICMRESLGLENRKVIVCVGRLENQKNIGFGIDVFQKMFEMDNTVFLLIVGDGPLKEDLYEKVKEYSLNDKIRFLGFKENLEDIFNASDLLLFPSLYEGLPITVVTAQCSGLPCLLSNTISSEIQLTELIEFISLKAGLDEWASKGLSMISDERRSYKQEIIDKNYSIIEESKRLEDYYLNL